MKSLAIFLSILLLTSLFVIVGGNLATNAYAETNEDRTVRIPVGSASTANGAGPAGEVTAASGNNRFVVWYDSTPGNYDILFRRSTDNGPNWQPTVNLSNNPGPSYIPQIAVSGSNAYVTWYDYTTGNYEILLRRSTDNGATLQPLVQISNNAGASRDPQITTVGSDVYIIWVDNTPGNDDIFLRRSADDGSTWKAVKNLSSNAGFSYLVPVA